MAAPGSLTSARAAEAAGVKAEPLEQLASVRDYVARNIRLIDIGLADLPLASLSRPDETLTAGYASQPDRTILIGAMLKALGFEPEYVLASGLPAVDGLEAALQPAAPAVFTRLLVRVRVGRQAYWLGDSDQYAPLGVSAHAGLLALDARGRIFKLESAPGLSDRLDSRITLRLKDDLAAEITVERRYAGAYRASFVRGLKESTPEERRRRHLEELAGIRRGARPLGQPASQVDDKTATARFALVCPDYALRQGGLVYLDIYGLITRLGGVAAEIRTTPLLLATPLRRQTAITIELPPGRLVSAPPALNLELPGGRLTISSRWDAARHRLMIEQTIQNEAALVSAEAYASLLQAQARLESPELRCLIFEPAQTK
ncbi:MAG: hypothetical protein BWY87_00686 [Deltaproteobacteria bacterium ADurb.Bin510]|nr:MAG: hypothetical protein BWY87_00686 [Deltaproteobacteria bacterium ADurb.Bin510]